MKFRDYRDGAQDHDAPAEVALAFTVDAADPADPTNPLRRVELRAGDDVVYLVDATAIGGRFLRTSHLRGAVAMTGLAGIARVAA